MTRTLILKLLRDYRVALPIVALLLAQPIRRSQIMLAHLLIDAMTIPVLCLSMWAGTCVGANLVGLTGATDPKLQVHLAAFGPALINVGVLVFAVSGITMALS